MHIKDGSLVVGRALGAQLTFHWSTPIGLYVLGGMRGEPATWAAVVFLIFAHECGHALLVRRYGYRVTAIRIHGLGGLCEWTGPATPTEHAKIAWGGVLAQGAILLATLLFLRWFPMRPYSALARVTDVLTWSNALLIVVNLLPIRPLDGGLAWSLLDLRAIRKRLRRRSLDARYHRFEQQLKALRRPDPNDWN